MKEKLLEVDIAMNILKNEMLKDIYLSLKSEYKYPINNYNVRTY